MTDFDLLHAERGAAPQDPALSDKLRATILSGVPINQVPQLWQTIVQLGRQVCRGRAGLATFTALVTDVFGDAIPDPGYLVVEGPSSGVFDAAVTFDATSGRGQIVATSADGALGLNPDHYRWLLIPDPGYYPTGPVATFPNLMPGTYTVDHGVVLCGITETTQKILTVPATT